MTKELKTVINYRRQKARETLADAQLLLENQRWRSCVNRIYYALFYEVIALLLTRKLYASTHTGVKALFNQHFAKTGIVSGHWGSFYSKMFDYRQQADYEDEEKCNADQTKQWFFKAQEFISLIEEVIEYELTKDNVEDDKR